MQRSFRLTTDTTASDDTPKPRTDPLFDELEDAIKWRLEVVADRELYERDAAEHLARLQKASATVTRLASELSPDTDPMLRHFLERQSYVKALDWLKTRRR